MAPTHACPKCAAEVRQGWRVCPGCEARLSLVQGEVETETVFHGSSSGSSAEEGRFPAGTVLAGRYRVLGLIGQGGMGEVYRAYDLILNQSVALKFLGRANMDEAALARFRNEVRIARQVSHPNVCRVYDIGFIDGFHFLSMEYLDGEDLASLIRRIGRLPQDKAIEFTRKICAGLSAAHERGVLHRDLKPANIMIDGRGQVRITDFGLAALAQEIALGDIRSGTPAYMSPEQKAGREVTTRSDIYSLGLTLHEMFTGKRRSETHSNPSDIVKDLDPAVERVILRCIEDDPKRRPSSALSVAMALPGGDPIAAALAAGETPSPEMVAASGEKEGFSPRTAVLCLLAAVFGFFGAALLAGKLSLLTRAPLELPTEAMAFRAQEILRQLGYTEKPKTVVDGFAYFGQDYASQLWRRPSAERDALLATQRPAIAGFWYRQHQDLIWADSFILQFKTGGQVDYDSPANIEPGMIRLILDGEGRLSALEARPSRESENRAGGAPDWGVLFTASGLDPVRFAPAPPEEIPTMAFDARMAWTGTFAEGRTEKVRVEAASWHGRPVYFNITGDWRRPESNAHVGVITFLVFVVILVGASLLTWNNLRLGRCDRRGAARVAVITFLLAMSAWGLTAEHVASYWELHIAVSGLSVAAFVAALFWSLYIAIEPHVRRNWPDALISWTRLLAGRMRDPLVASHILAGVAVAGLFGVLNWTLGHAAEHLSDSWVLATPALRALDSVPWFVSEILFRVFVGTFMVIAFHFLVVVSRLVVRRVIIADTAVSILFGALTIASGVGLPENALVVTATALGYYSLVWVLRRFGLLAAWALLVTTQLVQAAPLILPSWYAGRALVGIAIPAVVAAWALWVVVSAQSRHASDSTA